MPCGPYASLDDKPSHAVDLLPAATRASRGRMPRIVLKNKFSPLGMDGQGRVDREMVHYKIRQGTCIQIHQPQERLHGFNRFFLAKDDLSVSPIDVFTAHALTRQNPRSGREALRPGT